MELGAAGLQEQPFRTHGRPLVFVAYAAQRSAFEYLERIYDHRFGLGLIQGPPLSGKSTLLRQFAKIKSSDVAVALVDGASQNTNALPAGLITPVRLRTRIQHGQRVTQYAHVFPAATDRIRTDTAPDRRKHARNEPERTAGAVRTVRAAGETALRAATGVGQRPADDLDHGRACDEWHFEARDRHLKLGPLTQDETTDYLYAKLRTGGCFDPENVLPDNVCDELHDAAGGWPGILDRLAILALAKAEYCPIQPEQIERPVLPRFTEADAGNTEADDDANKIGPPKIFLTLNGETLREMTIERRRLLIGRSEHNDLTIKSSYISRHHAMFVKFGVAPLLMHLNSRNGTFVNSRRISNQVIIQGIIQKH